MDSDLLDALRSNALFRGMPSEDLDKILNRLEMVTYEAHEVVFEENDPGDFTYLIASGEVCISKRRGNDSRDRQEILAYLQKGDFFGEMAIYDPAPRSARAVAVLDSTLVRLNRDALEQLSRAAPLQIAENLTREAIRRLRLANSRHIQEILEAERLTAVGSMASTIIHDLKNPISQIRVAATLLEKGVAPERLPWLVGIIRNAVTRMLELTQDLLEYSRGGIINLTPREIPLKELIDELRQEILDDLTAKGYEVEIESSDDAPVELDWPRFRRVLVNMLTNAAEAMPDGGPIELAFHRPGGFLQISIRDWGCGIPEDIVGKIFDPFFTRGKIHGTGLGMWIARAIVEAHGGTIDVESEPEKGCCFTITLPQPVPRSDLTPL